VSGLNARIMTHSIEPRHRKRREEHTHIGQAMRHLSAFWGKRIEKILAAGAISR
jgi:hypothetical protein